VDDPVDRSDDVVHIVVADVQLPVIDPVSVEIPVGVDRGIAVLSEDVATAIVVGYSVSRV
jgi:hypothetical protein